MSVFFWLCLIALIIALVVWYYLSQRRASEKPTEVQTIPAQKAQPQASSDSTAQRTVAEKTDDAVATTAQAKSAPAPTPVKPAASEAPQEGPLFEAPDATPDQLTDIKGIGPVAERQLKEQGITTFAQIAALSADDIQRIDDYMPFSAKQIRSWQEQAKTRT